MSSLLWDPLLSCGAPRFAAWPLDYPWILAAAWIAWRRRKALALLLRELGLLLGLTAFWLLPGMERIKDCGWVLPRLGWTQPADADTQALAAILRNARLAVDASAQPRQADLLRRYRGKLPLNWGAAAQSRHLSLLNKLREQGGPGSEDLLTLSGVAVLHDGQKWARRTPALRAAFVEHATRSKGELAAHPFYSRPLQLDEPDIDAGPGEGPGNWTLLERQSESATSCRVDLPAGHPAGWIFLGDTYYPGWMAWVDGAPRRILRAEIAFRAVRVHANEKVVEFQYRPVSLYAGLGITLFTLAFLLWPAAFARPKRL